MSATSEVPARSTLVLVALIAAASLANLNLSVANVALPEIARHFDASQVGVNIVAVGFSLGLATSVLWLGALGDRYGRRRMLLLGTALGIPTSILAAYAPSMEVLGFARLLGGVAAGMAFPTTLALITALWNGASRTRSIAIWSGVGGAMAALGPLGAGILLTHFWWGSVFLLTIPIAIVAFGLSWWLVPAHVNESTDSVDNLGGLLSVVMIGGVVLAINFAPVPGLTTPTLLCGAVGLLAVLGFILRQRRAASPLYDLHVAARRTFWVSATAGILVFGALMGAMYVGQQYLQNVLDYSTWQAGLAIVPAAIVMMALSPYTATVIEQHGSRVALLWGYAFCSLGFLVMLLTWGTHTSPLVVMLGYVLLGAGVALGGSPASRSLTSSVPVRRVGMASGTADLQRDLGGAIMQSILGALLTAGYAGAFTKAVAASPEATQITDQVVGQLTKSYAGAAGVAERYPQYASEIIRAADSSFVTGQRWAFAAGLVCMVCGMALVATCFPRRDRERAMVAEFARLDA